MANSTISPFISDLFFNFIAHEAQRLNRKVSRTFVSDIAGSFSKALFDSNLILTPQELREDFFGRL